MEAAVAPEVAPTPIKAIVRGTYDLQKLRIQMGNRIVANFKAKIGQLPSMPEDQLDPPAKDLLADLRENKIKLADIVSALTAKNATIEDDGDDDGEEDDTPEVSGKQTREASKIGKILLQHLLRQFMAITEKRKKFPKPNEFTGNMLISSYVELCLVSEYVDMMKAEETSFTRLDPILMQYPIYAEFLSQIPGIGPAMGGVILSEINIHRARHPSSLWKYAGLDVKPDGLGASRRKEHLIKVKYIDTKGKEQERDSITFNPFLKTKLVGVLGTSFLRTKGCPYRMLYDNYKHRLEHRPDTMEVADKALNKGRKGRRHAMSMRYMVKQFLVQLHLRWRVLEGYPPSTPYNEGKLGMKHGE